MLTARLAAAAAETAAAQAASDAAAQAARSAPPSVAFPDSYGGGSYRGRAPSQPRTRSTSTRAPRQPRADPGFDLGDAAKMGTRIITSSTTNTILRGIFGILGGKKR
jgi:membrane protein involved in colicin uptake